MRLRSSHPNYLDRVGLVALWREALLAQKILKGKTRGCRKHPQLERFNKSRDRLGAIAYYLIWIWKESRRRDFLVTKRK